MLGAQDPWACTALKKYVVIMFNEDPKIKGLGFRGKKS